MRRLDERVVLFELLISDVTHETEARHGKINTKRECVWDACALAEASDTLLALRWLLLKDKETKQQTAAMPLL